MRSSASVLRGYKPFVLREGGAVAFVELLGSEKTLDEKRQKRAEEARKAMESEQAEKPPPTEEAPAREEKKE